MKDGIFFSILAIFSLCGSLIIFLLAYILNDNIFFFFCIILCVLGGYNSLNNKLDKIIKRLDK